jgi:hypothetical protein
MAGKIIADTIEASGSQISLNVGNVTVLTASSTGLTLIPTTNVNVNLTNSIVTLTNGSATSPGLTFSGNTRTGLFMPSANTLAFTAANTESMRIDSSGNVGIGTNSPSGKLHVETAGTNYIYSRNGSASGIAGIICQNTTDTRGWRIDGTNFDMYDHSAGVTRMRIDSSGRVMINTTTADARLSVHTDGTNTALGYGLALVNDAGGGNTWTLQCGQYAVNNGKFTIYDKTNNKYPLLIDASTMYITMPGVYALTSGSAANVFVATDGTLYRSTSSLKYKTNVQNATHGLAELLTLRPVTYKGKNDGDKVFGGLIAEEVHEAGLTEFVEYAEDGTPDALAYSNMVSLCIKSIQELKAIVDAQAVEIAALKAK